MEQIKELKKILKRLKKLKNDRILIEDEMSEDALCFSDKFVPDSPLLKGLKKSCLQLELIIKTFK